MDFSEVKRPPEVAMPTNDNPALPRGRIRRTMPLAGFTARAAGGRMVAALREKAGDAGAIARFHERTAERYSELLGQSKGVLMKAGQILSVVDASWIGNGEFSTYQAALSQLQADAPAMDPALAHDVLRADLGRSAHEVFAEFTDEPMAAASIGQVHRGVLHDGRHVAVKIQYPGAAEAIRDDLANTELLATFLRLVSSAVGTAMQTDLKRAAREIAARISEEIDYRHEAANIAAFSELYRDHPFIRIPEVVPEASGDRVLTMTYLDGMDWASAQYADQDLKDTWAEVILRFGTGSARHGNLFHADPHPGNYRFRTDGQVGFVDFGCVKIVPERFRRSYIGTVRAVLDGRMQDMRSLMTDAGFLTGDPTLTTDDIYQWWAEVLHEWLAPQPVTYTQETSRRAIRAVIPMSPDHTVRRMSMPDDVVFMSRISLNINTICAKLAATVHARSIPDDMDGVADPITPLGEQHREWLLRRGLPYGLESHDHT
jgi:predicted unusual protein kinase regulating ubiquinone biosynthesis (AarF/ABC1/UbiB family)